MAAELSSQKRWAQVSQILTGFRSSNGWFFDGTVGPVPIAPWSGARGQSPALIRILGFVAAEPRLTNHEDGRDYEDGQKVFAAILLCSAVG